MKAFLYLGNWKQHEGHLDFQEFNQLIEFDYPSNFNHFRSDNIIEPNNQTIITFKLNHTNKMARECMAMLRQNQLNDFTIFFYRNFNDISSDINDQPASLMTGQRNYLYDNAYIMKGYVVDVDDQTGANDRLILTVRILASTITYLDKVANEAVTLYISR